MGDPVASSFLAIVRRYWLVSARIEPFIYFYYRRGKQICAIFTRLFLTPNVVTSSFRLCARLQSNYAREGNYLLGEMVSRGEAGCVDMVRPPRALSADWSLALGVARKGESCILFGENAANQAVIFLSAVLRGLCTIRLVDCFLG